ncbi:MAG: MFS transporter [Chloroflexi bacterium]|nr:MFS transporter [Chloroflexota bacterium]
MSNGSEPLADTRSPLRRLFTSRSFVAFFIANTLGFGGEQMRLAAQSWWILDEGGSNAVMGLAAGLRVIPFIVVSLYAGVMIDRYGGKRILILERLILIVLALVTASILLLDQVQIWHIVVLSTLAGSTIALGNPATQTLVPEIVPKDLLQSANSVNQVSRALGQTLGPLVAGILIAVRSAALALFGLAAVYTGALLATFGISIRHEQLTTTDSATRQILDGLRYTRQTPILLWVILMGTSVIFSGMIFPIIPVFAKNVLEVSEVKFGWMWGAVALGQAAGGFVIAATNGFQRKSVQMLVGYGVFGLGLLGLALSETYWLSLVFLFVNGWGFPLLVVSWLTLIQQNSGREFAGRVMALFMLTQWSLISISWIVAGVLFDLIGAVPTVFVAVGGSWSIVLFTMIASRDLRRA